MNALFMVHTIFVCKNYLIRPTSRYKAPTI